MSMRRWLVLFFAVLLPLQFAWSAASAYCQHETNDRQSQHFGHHFHSHKGDVKKSTAGKLMTDPDCATCHATGAPAIAMNSGVSDFAAGSAAGVDVPTPLFTSALVRAPDRPQWLRLV